MDKSHDLQETIKVLRRGQFIPGRANVYWTDDEDRTLDALFSAGTGITQMALALQRTEQAVIQRLFKLKLLATPEDARKPRQKKPRCLCSNCVFQGVCEHCPLAEEG